MEQDFDDELEEGRGLEPTPGNLAHWLDDQYTGDDRFDSIEIDEPGSLEGEATRVRFIVDTHSAFFVGIFAEDGMARVGVATSSQEIVESIETAIEESGLSPTEFLEDTLNIDSDIEHEMRHFHDDVDYFCSEIPFQRPEDLASEVFRDEIIFYLDGYMNALLDYLEPED